MTHKLCTEGTQLYRKWLDKSIIVTGSPDRPSNQWSTLTAHVSTCSVCARCGSYFRLEDYRF